MVTLGGVIIFFFFLCICTSVYEAPILVKFLDYKCRAIFSKVFPHDWDPPIFFPMQLCWNTCVNALAYDPLLCGYGTPVCPISCCCHKAYTILLHCLIDSYGELAPFLKTISLTFFVGTFILRNSASRLRTCHGA